MPDPRLLSLCPVGTFAELGSGVCDCERDHVQVPEAVSLPLSPGPRLSIPRPCCADTHGSYVALCWHRGDACSLTQRDGRTPRLALGDPLPASSTQRKVPRPGFRRLPLSCLFCPAEEVAGVEGLTQLQLGPQGVGWGRPLLGAAPRNSSHRARLLSPSAHLSPQPEGAREAQEQLLFVLLVLWGKASCLSPLRAFHHPQLRSQHPLPLPTSAASTVRLPAPRAPGLCLHSQ